MAFWILILVGLVALGALVLWLLRDQSIAREHIDQQLHDPDTPTLEYAVPTGQDPVTILVALERAGFTASVDPHHTHQHVLVGCPDGVDHQRTLVRSVIGSTGRTDVRFVDERLTDGEPTSGRAGSA
jgi:hypothetical protein